MWKRWMLSVVMVISWLTLQWMSGCPTPTPQAHDASPPERPKTEAHTPQENPPKDARQAPIYRILTANVGNSDLAGCSDYDLKLCKEKVLQVLKTHIAQHKPDLIALQELLAARQCEGKNEKDPEKICAHYLPDKIPPVRRLLGPDYTIACEPRKQYECVAVHVNAGSIEGCEKGKLCNNARSLSPPQHCNEAFSISSVEVHLGTTSLRVINAHPDSKSFDCRAGLLAQVFEQPPKLADAPKVLLLGDLNMDPYRNNPDIDKSVALWQKYVGKGKAFHYHSGIAEHDPPYGTDLLKRTIDHVISNFATGTCKTLGAAPGTSRLDGKPETPLARLDHLTLLCTLTF